MLKNLVVDTGNSIGPIARFPIQNLKRKWENSVQLSKLGVINGRMSFNQRMPKNQSCRVLLLGKAFPLRVLDGMSDFDGIELLGYLRLSRQLGTN